MRWEAPCDLQGPELSLRIDISDELILKLVAKLDGSRLVPEDAKAPFEYFGTLIEYEGKQYRMVWLLEESEIYIGIITVYRDGRGRDGHH